MASYHEPSLDVPGHHVGSSRLIGGGGIRVLSASPSVVMLEPRVKGGGAVSVGREWPVGPLGLQGAVEPLHLAVLSGEVRLDELLPDATCGANVSQRVPVRPGMSKAGQAGPGDDPQYRPGWYSGPDGELVTAEPGAPDGQVRECERSNAGSRDPLLLRNQAVASKSGAIRPYLPELGSFS